MSCSHKLNSLDEVSDANEALPKGFHAGFAIALATEEATEHRNLANDLAQGRWTFGNRFFRQNIGRLAFLIGQKRTRVQVRLRTGRTYPTSPSPGNHPIDSQRPFKLADTPQLQGLNPTAVLEDREESLNFPARLIPIDPFSGRFKVRGLPVGQQAPLNRLDRLRGIDFLAIRPVIHSLPP